MTSRRVFLGASAAVLAGVATARGANSTTFVPGGRIGFTIPPGFAQEWFTWRYAAASGDLAFEAREGLRLEDDQHILWDNQFYAEAGSAPALPGFETKWLLLKGEGSYPGMRDEVLAIRDANWWGQVDFRLPGKADASTDRLRDELMRSVRVRPKPGLPQAMAEFGLECDFAGLNAQLRAPEIIFSPNVSDWKANGWPDMDSTWIQLGELNHLTLPHLMPLRKSRYWHEMRRGKYCEAGFEDEDTGARNLFALKAHIFSETRAASLSAVYQARDRDAVRAAMEQLVDTIRLL